MKKYILLASLVSIGISFASQAQNMLVIEMNDNSVYKIKENNIRDITFCSSAEETDDFVAYFSCPDDNHPHLIDLGLPSGTKWACCNIDANSPEEHGGHFAWGETEEKSYYDWTTYEIYTWDRKEEITDTKYDVAHIKWGGSWVMPTDKQVDELYKKCHWNWISQNGVYGCLVTGPNGGSIFLPAAGYCQYDRICDAGSLGSYWSSSSVHDKLVAYGFSFNSDYWSAGYFSIQRGGLSVGNSVRAVHMPVAQAIDLGLPSGTKWASWNVGAFSPEEPGGYFAWGETEIKNDYSSETYYNNGYFNPNDDIGATDYDVAHVMWGGSWRMPSVDQVKELFDNCSWSWTTQGRVNGILVIGRNGNTIFLPSIGYYVRDDLYGGSYYGSYWLSSRIWSLPQYLDFDLYLNPDCRDGRTPYCGLTVRAVCQ